MSRIRIFPALLCSVCLLCVAQLSPAAPSRTPARAAPRAAPAPSRAARPKPKVPSRATNKPAAKTAAPAPEAAAGPRPAAPAPGVPEAHGPPAGASEAKVAPANAAAIGVVKTEEAEQGVKTYTFGAEEVEGRMKSPQILYFLRRVRAEFDAEPLGHRSFLLELSDTRRHPSLE
ncbi:MAG TPA: hypothetical protein VFS67_35715 [Polyangiaceae bacterium]|nr:hypothetical protein [Polyangiaceae bacterium]